MTCSLFGHRDTDESIMPKIEAAIINAIENDGVNLFLVGNNGKFDKMARRLLVKLKSKYAIDYRVVLSAIPIKKREGDDYSDTVFPEFLQNVPPKFAILRRNELMIENSQCVITYAVFPFGGAHRCKELAIRKGKRVTEISEM